MSKGYKIVVTLLVILIWGIGTLLFLNETEVISLCKCKCGNDCPKCEQAPKKEEVNIEEVEKEAQKVYENAYNTLVGGTNAVDHSDCIKYVDLDLCIWNKELLESIFTDNAIYYINDYYSMNSEGKYYSDGTGLMSTIFGITDQGVRTLKYVLSENDTYVFRAEVSKCENEVCPPVYGGEYIGFKKVNDKLLVEFFQ